MPPLAISLLTLNKTMRGQSLCSRCPGMRTRALLFCINIGKKADQGFLVTPEL